MLLQLVVQAVLVRVLAAAEAAQSRVRLSTRRRIASLGGLSLLTVFSLLFCHISQMGVWTLLYIALGQFPNAADAAYFSLASFTTVGASELELARDHRVLGAIEAGVGILMFGWSTAILVSLIGISGVNQTRR